LAIDDIHKRQCEPDEFKSEEIDEEDEVVFCIGLFFVDFEANDGQLEEQDDGIDALATTSLEQIFIPMIGGVRGCLKIVDEEG
jgi:hypothetical protein